MAVRAVSFAVLATPLWGLRLTTNEESASAAAEHGSGVPVAIYQAYWAAQKNSTAPTPYNMVLGTCEDSFVRTCAAQSDSACGNGNNKTLGYCGEPEVIDSLTDAEIDVNGRPGYFTASCPDGSGKDDTKPSAECLGDATKPGTAEWCVTEKVADIRFLAVNGNKKGLPWEVKDCEEGEFGTCGQTTCVAESLAVGPLFLSAVECTNGTKIDQTECAETGEGFSIKRKLYEPLIGRNKNGWQRNAMETNDSYHSERDLMFEGCNVLTGNDTLQIISEDAKYKSGKLRWQDKATSSGNANVWSAVCMERR